MRASGGPVAPVPSYTRGMGLREIAQTLYVGDPAGFIAGRNAAAATADDKALAKEIRGLRKPSASAAAVNALVHDHGDLVDDILAVGDRMREAFADRDRDAIRSLTAERQRLLQKALRSAGPLSAAVQREVEDTLQAAVIDAAAAAAVRSGMLVRAIESTGVDQVDVTDAVALPVDVDAPAPPRPARKEPADSRRRASKAGTEPDGDADGADETDAAEEASRRREHERRIRTAEKALDRASAEAERLDDELDEEVDRRTDLEAERDSLTRRLERTQAELSESRAAERELRRRITNAQSALRDAQKALRAARDD